MKHNFLREITPTVAFGPSRVRQFAPDMGIAEPAAPDMASNLAAT